MSRSALLAGLVAYVSTGCGSKPAGEHAAPATSAALREGVAARVGGVEIAVDTVTRIARDQHVDARRARDLAITDALLAASATSSGLDRAPSATLSIDAVYARALLREIGSSAERAGPVTDDELAAVTARHWQELDRPAGYRTVHAVVQIDKQADDGRRRAAAAVADAIRRAVEPARQVAAESARPIAESADRPPPPDPAVEAFRAAAAAVPSDGFTVTVEELPPVTADGRVLGPEGVFDEHFSRAAATLAKRGDVSAPITSPFGLHVILLLELVPEHVVPADERRRLLHDEVMTDRARAAERALLEQLRSRVIVEGTADALLAEVSVTAPGTAGGQDVPTTGQAPR